LEIDMSVTQLDTENADRDLTSQVTVLTDTPDASNNLICQAYIAFGDGTKDLDGTGGNFELVITVGGQTIEPSPQLIAFSTAVRTAVWSSVFPVPANKEVVIKVKSPNAADSDVDVTAYLYDVVATMRGTDSANTTVPDVAGTAATLHGVTDGKIDTVDGVVDAILADTGTDGVKLANDAITAAKYDESTAFPIKSADTGATEIARTGADSDTLETLSDQLDALSAGDITVVGPVVSSSAITIISGDDYADADGRALEWTDDAYSGPIETGDTVTFRCERDVHYGTDEDSSAFEKAGSVVVSGADITIKVELTSAETAAFETGADNKYVFELELTDVSTSRILTYAQGVMTVTADVTEP